MLKHDKHAIFSICSFLCLPDSQMQCKISLPSLNVIFSTERLAEENLKDAGESHSSSILN